MRMLNFAPSPTKGRFARLGGFRCELTKKRTSLLSHRKCHFRRMRLCALFYHFVHALCSQTGIPLNIRLAFASVADKYAELPFVHCTKGHWLTLRLWNPDCQKCHEIYYTYVDPFYKYTNPFSLRMYYDILNKCVIFGECLLRFHNYALVH